MTGRRLPRGIMRPQASIQARDYSQEERDRMAESGEALPDGSFPIADREDLENAIQAIGRASDPAKAKAHIKKRAKALGLSELIPDTWDGIDRSVFQDRLKRPLARATTGKDKDWYRLQNKVGETPKLYIYDEIGYFGQTAKSLADELMGLDVDTLDVHLNSPGGDIFDGLAIYQALKTSKAKVTIRIDGLAASIASVIAMAGDSVIIGPKASMMVHDGWTMAVGNAADMRKAADLLDKQSDVIASVYADRTGQSADFWRDVMREECWYNAEEALEAGLVDEIEGRKKDDPADAFDLGVFAHAGRDKAPAPVIKPEHGPETVAPPAPETPVAKKDEPAPFVWDFAEFKSALQEGVK